MTQEEKELLLKDLCARLPYGVKCRQFKLDSQICTLSADLLDKVENIEPYLRPMSSMTEEERKEFIKCAGYEIEESVNGRHYEYFLKDFCGTLDNPSVNADGVDWLNYHHFDYHNLIEKGLALEAPKDMYKED